MALPWVKMQRNEPKTRAYWRWPGQSWAAARGLAPSPAAGDLPLNMSFKEKGVWTACTGLSDLGHPAGELGLGFPRCPSGAAPQLPRALGHAALPGFIILFLATRRNAGTAPTLLVVKVPQHFPGSSGSVEKSGFYFADRYQKQSNPGFCSEQSGCRVFGTARCCSHAYSAAALVQSQKQRHRGEKGERFEGSTETKLCVSSCKTRADLQEQPQLWACSSPHSREQQQSPGGC